MPTRFVSADIDGRIHPSVVSAMQGASAADFAAGDAPERVRRQTVGNAAPLMATRPSKDLVTRNPNNPIWTPLQSALGSLYWPYAIRVGHLPIDPYDEWYVYVSSDHNLSMGNSNGGVELLSCSELGGTLTSHGMVYTDELEESIETATVFWLPDVAPVVARPGGEQGRFAMMHQRYNRVTGSGQGTCLVLSDDGETWDDTIYGDWAVLDVPTGFWPGGGGRHTGYARVFELGLEYGCWSLSTGGSSSRTAFWTSPDGLQWTPEPRRLPRRIEQGGISWTQATPVRWQGALWVVFGYENTTIRMAPLAEDYQSIIGTPITILELEGDEINPSQAAALRSVQAIPNGDRIDLLYKAGGTTTTSNGTNGSIFHAWISAEAAA